MATGSISLAVGGAALPDGSTNNVGPRILLAKGTNTAPNRFLYYASFDPTTQQHLWWTFTVPTNYASGGTVRLMWAANATTGAVVWGASVGTQATSAADTYLAHNQATAVTATTNVLATTARRPVETQIALGANLDGIAAGRIAYIVIYRAAANAADTCTVDSELLSAEIDYVTS